MNNTTNSVITDNIINNNFININLLTITLIKLSLSTLFSFIVGFERELHTHPGGICTHTLVGIGSCLYTMVSVHTRDIYPSNNSDPARICAQIVSGMGFLGSATIFKSNSYVKGINTAANLWISAAISMAIGIGLWEFAAVGSLFTVFTLFINNRYKTYAYKNKNKNKNIKIDHDPLDAPYGDENDSDSDRNEIKIE
jgi:putative Mg2+ transporter-C (MgtC) family protein